MSEERRRILEMLAEGKIDVSGAEKLLAAVGDSCTGGTEEPAASSSAKTMPKYLRVMVAEKKGDCVDIRVPLQLLRAGVKLGSVIPQDAQAKINARLADKGIGFSVADLNPQTIEQLIEGMKDLSVDVAEATGNKVRIFCE